MRINHNISSMTTQSSLFKTQRSISKNLEKLSTGLRINSASDDAAGLAVSENLRMQVRGSGQARKNTQDAISMLQIADGALEEQSSILQRMRELALQAKNDTYTQTERNYMGTEFEALLDELDRIANVTNFNGMTLFATRSTVNNISGDPKSAGTAIDTWGDDTNAVFGANDNGAANHFNMMIGSNYTAADAAAFNNGTALNAYDTSAENLITIQLGQMDSEALFMTDASGAQPFSRYLKTPLGINAFEHNGGALLNANFGTDLQQKLTTLIELIDGSPITNNNGGIVVRGNNLTGLERVNTQRAYIGAMINRMESTVNNLMTNETNQQAAESQIRDVDFAYETAQFTKNQILSQSATSMLSQANMVPQGVLQLLG